MKYVVWDFPLDIHDNAMAAAEATHCAGDQGVYFPMYRLIFENSDAITRDALSEWAAQAGVADLNTFETCLNFGKHQKMIETDLDEAKQAGISSTPTFLVGYTDSSDPANGSVHIEEVLEGAESYQAFRRIFEEMLKEKK